MICLSIKNLFIYSPDSDGSADKCRADADLYSAIRKSDSPPRTNNRVNDYIKNNITDKNTFTYNTGKVSGILRENLDFINDAFELPKNFDFVLREFTVRLCDREVDAFLIFYDGLVNANYIGILAWAIIFGIALKAASETTKTVIENISDATSTAVRWIISLAPFGIMGLIFTTISEQGLGVLLSYGRLICVLVGTMLFVALVINPIVTFICTRQNPYPLVLRCLKDSGITAFFTRSSAANIPVNMELCKNLGLDEDTYSISIPLGATINMGGAAITISIMALAAAHTLGISVDFPTALILCILAAASAAGASGVAGGSLLLIPMACSLFGIPNDVAMQVVGVGFIVGVIQDSCETALNSSTDVLYTACACRIRKNK